MSDAPTIEFPCRYPIKVIGLKSDASARSILDIVRRHAPDITPDDITQRDSRNGNYASVRVTITATGEAQLKALHEELMADPSVKMVI